MNIFSRILYLFCICIFGATTSAVSSTTGQPDVIGEIKMLRTAEDETLMEIAKRAGLGFDNLANANPEIDPWLTPTGTLIRLPYQTILPAGASEGLTINLAEMRLFYLQRTNGTTTVDIYPLGIGREGRDTPVGDFQVVNKKEAPIWRVPSGLREADPSLPELVPSGPDNPLGNYWLGLSAEGYGIHGTNRPLGVGRRVSYGCIRMYPEHIAELYPHIPVGTKVRIVYQPIKSGWHGDVLMLEVHPDHSGCFDDLFQEALHVIGRTGGAVQIDYARVRDVVMRQTGLPEVIGSRVINRGGQN